MCLCRVDFCDSSEFALIRIFLDLQFRFFWIILSSLRCTERPLRFFCLSCFQSVNQQQINPDIWKQKIPMNLTSFGSRLDYRKPIGIFLPKWGQYISYQTMCRRTDWNLISSILLQNWHQRSLQQIKAELYYPAWLLCICTPPAAL